MLIDTHAHLDDKRIYPDIANLASQMRSDNLESIITVGCDDKSNKKCFEIAQSYDNIYCAAGIHPHEALTASPQSYELIAKLCADRKTVALGEIGLDFYYDFSPREVQERVFLEQLDLAYQLKIPVILHLRDAYQVMHRLLKDNKAKLAYGALLHCYSGSKEMLAEYVKLGLYASFGGSVTFKNAVEKPEVLKSVPADMFVLETDAPYLTPEPFRGRTNLPKYVNYVAERCAQILGVEKSEIEEITTKNAKAFFGKLPR